VNIDLAVVEALDLRVASRHPSSVSSAPHKLGLRTVAMFELLKGVLVLLLGFGALTLIHKDLDEIAERLIAFLRVNPGGKLSGFFFRLADHTSDRSLWFVAAGALVYSTVRFLEAYGLWHERAWAEWFALISGCIYLPWEIMGLAHHPHPWKWGVLITNILIVLYMAKLRVDGTRQRRNLSQVSPSRR
jgi:uncharacterized membrane protein (DUF2068 family)